MARRAQYTLAENASPGAQTGVDWQGGRGVLFCEATWGGGSVALEQQSPNGTWVPVDKLAGTAVTLSTNGAIPFETCAGPIRVNITTATAVYAYVVGTPLNIAG